jgi:hypothetical protein
MKLHRVLALVISTGLAAGGLAADDGRIEIGPTDTFPIVISGPGSYLLTADLEVTTEDVNAIEIHSPQRVSLDLGGHSIRGPCSGYGHGITIPDGLTARDVDIRNGTVSCFYRGVNPVSDWNRGGVIIENIRASENSDAGIFATLALIVDCNTSGNGGSGIKASGSVVRDCVSSRNGNHGIASGGNGLIQGCVVGLNGDDGIFLSGSANQVVHSSMWNNGGYGVFMSSNAHNNISHSTGSDNAAGNVINCGVGNGCHHNMLP